MQEDDIADLNELASMMHKFVSDIFGKITCMFAKDFFKKDFFWIFQFYLRYSILLRKPPLRFHSVGGCWNRGLWRL